MGASTDLAAFPVPAVELLLIVLLGFWISGSRLISQKFHTFDKVIQTLFLNMKIEYPSFQQPPKGYFWSEPEVRCFANRTSVSTFAGHDRRC
jgi:hypothetical protein